MPARLPGYLRDARHRARDGKNANELTSQALTDTGRAPTFYDCLVEVEPAL